MKKYLFIVTLFILGSLLFFSCSKNDEDYYSLDKIWVTMGLVETTDSFGSEFVIYCDNGDTIVPISYSNNIDIVDSQRVIINYTILDEVGEAKHTFYARINNIQNVLLKEVIELNDVNKDSLGNDPVIISDIWITKDLLNIEFYYTGEQLTHFINLAYVKDSIEPIILYLKHNANNDNESYNLHGFVTFNIKKLQIEKRNSIDFNVKSVDYFNKEHTFTGTYNY